MSDSNDIVISSIKFNCIQKEIQKARSDLQSYKDTIKEIWINGFAYNYIFENDFRELDEFFKYITFLSAISTRCLSVLSRPRIPNHDA